MDVLIQRDLVLDKVDSPPVVTPKSFRGGGGREDGPGAVGDVGYLAVQKHPGQDGFCLHPS